MRKVLALLLAVLLLLNAKSAVAESLWDIAQQVLGAVGMVVGVATGDESLASNGLQVFQNGQGIGPSDQSDLPADSSLPDSDEQPASSMSLAQSGDLQAIANRCAAIADRVVPNANQQNTILMYQACIAVCGYQATGNDKYKQIYEHAQRGAIELCGRNASSDCNIVRPRDCKI